MLGISIKQNSIISNIFEIERTWCFILSSHDFPFAFTCSLHSRSFITDSLGIHSRHFFLALYIIFALCALSPFRNVFQIFLTCFKQKMPNIIWNILNLSELLVVSLQILVIQPSGNERSSSCRKYSDAQVSKRIKFYVYSEYSAKFRVEILPMNGYLFISIHGLGSLSLISPGFNVPDYSICLLYTSPSPRD